MLREEARGWFAVSVSGGIVWGGGICYNRRFGRGCTIDPGAGSGAARSPTVRHSFVTGCGVPVGCLGCVILLFTDLLHKDQGNTGQMGQIDPEEIHAGAIVLKTEHDRGFIERPVICPNFTVHHVQPDALFLVSESGSYSLSGDVLLALAPYLDGSYSRGEILEALSAEGSFSSLQVNAALVHCATKGYIVSAEVEMTPGQMAWWCDAMVAPRYAQERLQTCRPCLVEYTAAAGSQGKLLRGHLEEQYGLSVLEGGERPTLYLVLTDDYLHPQLADFNRARLEDGVPWILLSGAGLQPKVGPAFVPGQGSCWECLSFRMLLNQEVKSFLGLRVQQDAVIRPAVPHAMLAAAWMQHAAMEIAKWVVMGEYAGIHEQLLSCNSLAMELEYHRVTRRPQCRSCGNPTLYRPDRAPQALQLQSHTKAVFTSGGMRTASPRETLARYRDQVSPLSGAVTQLERISEKDDNWLHVYAAGSNMALNNTSLYLLRTSLRSKSCGKGASAEQAEVSALCEAIERYSGCYHGDEIRVHKSMADFPAGEALHPNDIMLFSDKQFRERDAINARQHRFCYVVSPFDPEEKRDWTPFWSLTEERHKYLPTFQTYYSVPARDSLPQCSPDSNGAASGSSLEDAILQGFLELVERDCFALWWYNRLRYPAVDIDSFDNPFLSGAQEYYQRYNRDLWVLDLSADLGIPVFVALSRRTDQEVQDLLFSAGAHFNPHIAMLRAVCELNQYLHSVRDVQGGEGYEYDDRESVEWWRTATLENQPHFVPRKGAPRRKKDFNIPPQGDLREDIRRCVALLRDKGMEMLVLDQTRPDIGLPVAKVVVPGMRHFWSRLAGGRLYEVPVQMRWLKAPQREEELNPIPVFI